MELLGTLNQSGARPILRHDKPKDRPTRPGLPHVLTAAHPDPIMNIMRLSKQEKEHILLAVRRFDGRARVFLFGSRAVDAKKGGDIDLLILSDTISSAEKRLIRGLICDAMGDQRVDIVVAADASNPLVRIAQDTGVLLQ